jgi:hypothetical protein
VPPRRGSRSSPPPFPAAPSGRTSSRQLSPPSTMRRRAPKRPTGPRSPPLRRPAPLGRRPGRRAQPRRRHQHGRRTPGRPRAGPASSWSGVSVPTLGSTPIVASARSAATSSSGLATLLPRSRLTEPQPGWPRTSSSSATSIDRSLACRAGLPPDSDFEDHTGLQGELGFGLYRIRMALRSFSVNRDNRPLRKAVFG